MSLCIETSHSLGLYITKCYCLSQYMHPFLNTRITCLDTLIRLSAPCIAYLNTLSRLHILIDELPILIHRPTIPYPNTLSWTIPYLNILNRTIPYLNTITRTIPYFTTLIRIHSDFGNSSRQPIRLEYYVTRVVSRSESSVTSLGSQSNSSIT